MHRLPVACSPAALRRPAAARAAAADPPACRAPPAAALQATARDAVGAGRCRQAPVTHGTSLVLIAEWLWATYAVAACLYFASDHGFMRLGHSRSRVTRRQCQGKEAGAYQRQQGYEREVAQALDRSRHKERLLETQPLDQQPARHLECQSLPRTMEAYDYYAFWTGFRSRQASSTAPAQGRGPAPAHRTHALQRIDLAAMPLGHVVHEDRSQQRPSCIGEGHPCEMHLCIVANTSHKDPCLHPCYRFNVG